MMCRCTKINAELHEVSRNRTVMPQSGRRRTVGPSLAVRVPTSSNSASTISKSLYWSSESWRGYFAETAVAALLASGTVSQIAAGVVDLDLANGSAVIADLEEPDRVRTRSSHAASILGKVMSVVRSGRRSRVQQRAGDPVDENAGDDADHRGHEQLGSIGAYRAGAAGGRPGRRTLAGRRRRADIH